MNIEITFPQYGIVKSTWDLYRMSRPTYNEHERNKGNIIAHVGGLPDVWRISEKSPTGQPEFIPLNYENTHYLMRCNLEAFTGKSYSRDEYFDWYENNKDSPLLKQLESACTKDRSHTNFYGMDNSHNWLTGERPDEDNPKFAKLITGRACVKMVMENGMPMVRNISGVGASAAFECINASEDVWRFSPLTHNWLFDQPLITGRMVGYFPTGGAYLIRDDLHTEYPQFQGKLVFPIWMPAVDVAWIPTANIKYVPTYQDKQWT